MTVPVDVANMALGALGVGLEIANLETDPDPTAQACRRFYDRARDTLLREGLWGFATTSGPLALVALDPTAEWAYSYRVPTDCLRFRRIVPECASQTRVPVRLALDSVGPIVLTDAPNAVGEWTTRVVDLTLWPADVVLALSLLLATLIAPLVTGGDPFKLGNRSFELYRNYLASARAVSANEETASVPPESDLIRYRM